MRPWAALILWNGIGVALDLIGVTTMTTTTTAERCDHPVTVRIMAGAWKCSRCGTLIEVGEKAPKAVERKRRALSRLTTFGRGGR